MVVFDVNMKKNLRRPFKFFHDWYFENLWAWRHLSWQYHTIPVYHNIPSTYIHSRRTPLWTISNILQ